MSEQDLDEIVQITVEDFNQDDHTGKISVKQHEKLFFLIHIDILCSFGQIWRHCLVARAALSSMAFNQ